MNFSVTETKVFAFIFLIFTNFTLAVAQDDSSIYQIPAGTTMRVRMDNEINSKVAGVDDTFTMTLAAPVIRRETVVLPTGTIIEGRITKVRRAAFGGKHGDLKFSIQTLYLANNVKREIEGVLSGELNAANSPSNANVLTILGGTAIGGIGGALSKADNGALIGAGIGAGIGTGIAFLRKGKDIGIKADEEFEIKLTKDVILPARDF